ncbi:TetR/AcrR family transcriptional regulator [Levilactobacillus sp. N40-8-2]|uniref:TetR/AcrR family transcriptional regulator n=1 Tax=Levilactobacillus muriae TaxID=3238987 RepID=UPI0038B29156
MTKRDENAKTTRRKLLDAADRLIVERGYENVFVEDITTASGVAKGTFYNYFPKKEDIIGELEREHFSQLNAQINEISDELTPAANISAYLANFMQITVKAGVERARGWIRFVAVPNSLDDKWTYDFGKVSELLTQLIQHGQLEKETPVEMIAQVLSMQLYGVIFSWVMNKSIDPQKAIQNFCAILVEPLIQPYITAV